MEIDAVPNVAEETAAVGMSEQSDVINAADLYTPEANGANAQTDGAAQTDAPASDRQTNERMYTSDEMSAAIQKRLKQERRSAAYQLGREYLDEYMTANKVSEADALAQIREQRIKERAAQFKADPEKGFEELLRRREQPSEPEDTPTSGGDVQRVYEEIVQEINDGKVPQGFDLSNYLSEPTRARRFLKWRESLGIEEACAIAMETGAAQPMTKTEMNRALPKSVGTNNAYNPKKIDYSEMSSEDFKAVDEKIKRMYASGKRVEF